MIESRTLGGSVFGVGKYLSPRLYVGYGVSLLGTGHVLTLRYLLGLGFDVAGRLWASEMGPQGGDELNLIVPGGNYGWPRASNGSHYGGGAIPDHAPGDGFVAPSAWWTPSVSPGSLLMYDGTALPDWRGDALLGALSGEALIHVDLDGDRVLGTETLPLGRRIRALAQGPDGTLWLLEDGPGARLLRVGIG